MTHNTATARKVLAEIQLAWSAAASAADLMAARNI
ncbi:hypothetical protein F4827_003034 [Paraburkholderia bannensis]|uniref:Uncharacterized protein n=1 Tax=Paraburkholderia bannensis TaxID=765414 RepID=A0A7W9TXY5_9BURK|nr:hypothetical protein [Paraburkholderia sp. WP4_3_2]MBB6103179.1 hypothetical protein [Paraburkholderia bannensis]